MTESQVGFLYKAQSFLQQARDTESISILRSYYLMRCKDITKGYGLPDKHYSSKARCSKCCIEWRKNAEVKIKALKLSKKQKRRIRSQKGKLNKEHIQRRKELLNSNEIEQVCTFCKLSTFTRAVKPVKVTPKPQKEINVTVNKEVKANEIKKKQTKNIAKDNKKMEVNVYSNTAEVFSLNNNKNNLPNTSKEGQKIIKNNKKKKDKFAGLCQKAVLASAKLKEEKKKDKINLFLKPSL